MDNLGSKKILNEKPVTNIKKIEQSYLTFMGKVNLYTIWYDEKNTERKSELIECIRRNLDNKYIDKMYIISDEGSLFNEFKHDKLTVIQNKIRTTYYKMFDIINNTSSNSDINIIANTDIFFDSTLKLIFNKINSNNSFCLTRWDVVKDGRLEFHNRRDSQDAWIFCGKIKDGMNTSFFLGKPGCDNRIAYELINIGYEVFNPSQSIIIHHLHRSGVRNYVPNSNDRVPKPYSYLNPCKIDAIKTNEKKVMHIGLNLKGQTSLCKALGSLGKYKSINWRKKLLSLNNSVNKLNNYILDTVNEFMPDFIFMQIQTPDIIFPSTISNIKNIPILNWNGDIRNVTPRWMVELAQFPNVHTGFTNGRDINNFKKLGIENVHYIQIGFEENVYNPDIELEKNNLAVFAGSLYSDKFPLTQLRKEMVEKLKAEFKNDFSVFGGNWGKFSSGSLIPKETAKIYKGSKFAISVNNINEFRYSSDRLLNIMATGTFCFAHYCEGLELDFQDKKHLVYWRTADELISLIKEYKNKDDIVNQIAYDGMTQVWVKHRWQNRINQIKDEVLNW